MQRTKIFVAPEDISKPHIVMLMISRKRRYLSLEWGQLHQRLANRELVYRVINGLDGIGILIYCPPPHIGKKRA